MEWKNRRENYAEEKGQIENLPRIEELERVYLTLSLYVPRPQKANQMILTDGNFDLEVIHSDRLTLVYFWASWCDEHRFMSPIIAAVENEKPDIKVGLLNVDENPGTSQRHGIASVPTVIIFAPSRERRRIEGVTSKTHLISTIDMLTSGEGEIQDATEKGVS